MRLNSSFAVRIIVAVLTACVTIWTGGMLLTACLDALKLRDPAEVQATILDVNRQMVTSGDGSREQVVVTYEYRFEDQRFEKSTERVTLYGRTSGVYDRLERSKNEGRSVPCYVSRADPSLSVFSLEFSLPLLFVHSLFPLMFGGCCVLMIWSFVKEVRQHKTQTGKRARG
ncbi:MAG: DUF3592 domain-containing protein [Planctomycetota bacterium]